MLSSGGVKGNWGCELLVNLRIPYAKRGDKEFFSPRHFVVVEASPRLLVVKVAAPFWQTAICVAHAPHDGAAQADRQEWWARLGDCVTKFGVDLLS